MSTIHCTHEKLEGPSNHQVAFVGRMIGVSSDSKEFGLEESAVGMTTKAVGKTQDSTLVSDQGPTRER